jgi:hypothetical protein
MADFMRHQVEARILHCSLAMELEDDPFCCINISDMCDLVHSHEINSVVCRSLPRDLPSSTCSVQYCGECVTDELDKQTHSSPNPSVTNVPGNDEMVEDQLPSSPCAVPKLNRLGKLGIGLNVLRSLGKSLFSSKS